MSEKGDLTKEEKEIAKKNGFIISGKTGSGKTTLLNAIFGKEMGKVERSAKRVTTVSKVYYYKLENGKCITIIDTPGLSDTEKLINEDIDNIHLDGITKEISKENIQIKGILFLVNFQNERFDSDEQDALLKYNEIFPLRRFWKNLIVIFTHHFGDPNGDDVDEMKTERDESNGEIFTRLMDKVIEVSDKIEYNELKTKYFNSYFPINKKKEQFQIESNIKVRNELETELDKLIATEPLFSQVEIMSVTDYKIEENGKKYLANVEIIGFFDLNQNNIPIKEKVKVLSKREITENEPAPEPTIKVEVHSAKIGEDQKIHYETKVEDKNTDNPSSKYIKNYIGTKTGAAVGSIGGLIIGGIAAGAAGVAALPAVGIGAAVAGAATFIGWLFD